MSTQTRRQESFLRFLYEANSQQKKRLIDLATGEQLQAFREVVMNLYMGLPPPPFQMDTKQN